MKDSKFHQLLFVLFLQLVGINSQFLCQHIGITDDNDYQEFTTSDSHTSHTEDSGFYSQGLNFSTSQSQTSTEFVNENSSTIDISTFFSTEKIADVARKKIKVIFDYYQREFDQRYLEKFNYSDIFQDSMKSSPLGNQSETFNLEKYHFSSFPHLYEIYEYLEILEKIGKGRAIVTPLRLYNGSWSIVHTNLGNEILSIYISSKPLKSHEQNPIIFVVAGIHGCDWYAVQSAIFLARELIINGERDSSKNFDWWIVPILNPDGYQITQTDSKWRNWKKNLQGTKNYEIDECFGLDLDLNFEYQWLSCNDTLCDSNFPGYDPFTTPEARGLRDTLEAYSDYCDSFIALKEGQQALVFPFSDTLEGPRDLDRLENLCEKAVDAFHNHVEGFYDYGQSSHLIETRAGFIEDWAKIHLGIVKSFAFYLGPREKDRRELKSQHLMDHMNGTFHLVNVIAHGKIDKNVPNSSWSVYSSLLFITLNFLIVQYFH